jgi:hypothetical protein
MSTSRHRRVGIYVDMSGIERIIVRPKIHTDMILSIYHSKYLNTL